MGISVRDGRVNHFGNGQGAFQALALLDMISTFAKWLPDMDLAFNVHDDPRVAIAHDELAMRVAAGRESQGRLNSISHLQGDFSSRPDELELPIEVMSQARFYDLGRQFTWQVSRMSCPLASPARNPNGEALGDTAAYTTTPLNFVYNQTAFSDICLNPALRHHLASANQPNVYRVTNELCPIFSASKLSSFQDILYPSPWYYADQTVYDRNFAVGWEDKAPQLYWGRSASDGRSGDGEWHNWLHQRVLANLKAQGNKLVLQRINGSCNNIGLAREMKQELLAESGDDSDPESTRIDPCSSGGCINGEDFIRIAKQDEEERAWKYRYLLDMDEHTYSGRFYASLRSKSLPLKLAYLREWHSEFILPWVHYAPLSLEGKEYRETFRYFEHEGSGTARYLASSGEEWVKRTLTRDHFQVWMFRLLLEYV
jgi:hypothetical protein